MILAILALLQDPVKLEYKPRAGDRSPVRMESSVSLEIVASDKIEGTKTRTLSLNSSDEFVQEITEADGSQVRRAKVRCTASSRRRITEGKPPVEQVTAMQGRDYEVVYGASTRVLTDTGEEAGPEAETVGAWAGFVKLLPAEAKKVGASWKVPAADVAAALWVGFEDSLGDLEITLSEVKDNKATLSLKGTVKGETRDEFAGSLTLTSATLVFDLAAGKPVSFALTGDLSLAKEIVEKRPKPGSLTEEIQVSHGDVKVAGRVTVSVRFE